MRLSLKDTTASVDPMSQSASQVIPGIIPTELQNGIDRLAAIGTTRLAYTAEDIRGRQLTAEMMREASLQIRIDSAGNMFGRREGSQDLPPIVFGSHVDTVRGGGRYDGVLGVIAGIACIQALERASIQTRHPLEVVVFANEEGQRFGALVGSRAAVGDLSECDLDIRDESGESLRDAIRAVGGCPEAIASSSLKAGDIAAYLELHIEQGGELEERGVSIGVVQGISGIQHVDVRFLGAANHSGTTAMSSRRDALVAAAALVLSVQQIAVERKLCRVATVGQLSVSPNSINIVPGEVKLTLELRDIDAARIDAALEVIRSQAISIACSHNVTLDFAPRPLVAPVLSHPTVIEQITGSCETLVLSHLAMPSGAGHDAQMMGRVAPMGMIFVPSVGGISHSPQEFTTPEDCSRGAEVLLHTILRLDRLSTEQLKGASQA